jgi:hypothetical protein
LLDEQFVHLRRQAVRISQGKEVDPFSALLPAKDGLKPTT